LFKELGLKGNEHFYKKEYEKAIECYDKALEIDPKDILAMELKQMENQPGWRLIQRKPKDGKTRPLIL